MGTRRRRRGRDRIHTSAAQPSSAAHKEDVLERCREPAERALGAKSGRRVIEVSDVIPRNDRRLEHNGRRLAGERLLLRDDVEADADTLVADLHPRSGNELPDVPLRLVAERTAQFSQGHGKGEYAAEGGREEGPVTEGEIEWTRVVRRSEDGERMAKNSRAVPDRSPGSSPWVKRDTDTGRYVDQKTSAKSVRREILFPTEPSTIGHKKIDRAVEHVISRKK